jgi:hypothetical protein
MIAENKALCQRTFRHGIGITSGANPSVYAMGMVLTNYPSIDEGQIMILVSRRLNDKEVRLALARHNIFHVKCV